MRRRLFPWRTSGRPPWLRHWVLPTADSQTLPNYSLAWYCSVFKPQPLDDAPIYQEDGGPPVQTLWNKLPSEITLLVVEFLIGESVPKLLTYNFFRARARRGLVQVVHQLVTDCYVALGEGSGHSRPTTVMERLQYPPYMLDDVLKAVGFVNYALVCKAWRDEFYSHFYGSNHFIFNITPADMECGFRSRDYASFESWCRPVQNAGPSDSPLGPIRPNAIRFLRKVTLVVALSRAQKASHLHRLKSQVQHAVDLLKDNETRLETLRVHLVYADNVPGRRYTPSVNVLWVEVSRSTRKLHVNIADDVITAVNNSSEFERILEPLAAMRCIKDFVVTGEITKEFSQKLGTLVTSEINPEKPTNEQLDENLPPRKRQRNRK
jgi:hypothetical protein